MAGARTGKDRRRSRRSDLGWLIWESFQYTHRSFEEVVRPHGVTGTQLNMLMRIAEQPGSSGADLARQALTTTQAANLALSALERKQLVQRTRSDGIGNVYQTVLTDTGRVVVSECLREVKEVEGRLLTTLTKAERDTLRNLLQKYTEPWSAGA